MTKFEIIEKYFRSQEDLGVSNDLILNEKFVLRQAQQPNNAGQSHNIGQPYNTGQPQGIAPTVNPISVGADPRVCPPHPEEKTVGATALGRPQQTDNKEDNRREELAELFYKCRNCKACSLSQTRKNFVFGAGTAYTDIMVIGEAPGADEDEQGKPFVGAAGQLLTKMLAAINLERDKIFIANILKCRPPQNRKPTPAEMATCFPLLRKQIEIIKPKAILLLGATAANAVLRNEKSVGSLRGIVHYYENIPAIVSYHPSALLRDASWKKPAWDDLQRFERLVKELRNG